MKINKTLVGCALGIVLFGAGMAQAQTICPYCGHRAVSAESQRVEGLAAENTIEDNPAIAAVSEYYKIEPVVTITILQSISEPDDLFMTLYLAREAKVSPTDLNNMRRNSMSWQQIIKDLGLEPQTLFTQMQNTKDTDKVWALRQLKNWVKSPDVSQLYDKTARRLAGIDYIMSANKMSAIKANNFIDEYGTTTDAAGITLK